MILIYAMFIKTKLDFNYNFNEAAFILTVRVLKSIYISACRDNKLDWNRISSWRYWNNWWNRSKGDKGDTGATGYQGPKGDTGDTGLGTIIKGSYPSYEALIEAHPTGTVTDAYLVNGIIYVWDTVNNEWKNSGSLKGPKGDKGNTGEKGVTGDTGDKCDTGEKGSKGDTGATGDTGPAGQTGDTGATGAGLTIKGSYNSYEELINEHPTGNDGDCYLVNGFLYVWNGNAWENVGNIKGDTCDVGPKGDTGAKGDTGVKGDTGDAFTFEDFTPEQLASLKGPKGDTGDKGQTGSKGDTGASGFSPTVNVNHQDREIVITSEEGSVTISFDELKGDTGASGTKGDTGDTGIKGDTGSKGDTGTKGDTGQTGPKGDTGDIGAKGDTGIGSDEEAGWKLPVDEIRTTNTLPTGINAGYRVAIITSSVMAIKEYNGSSWDIENLDPYSVIPLKHSGDIQMYLAKSSGPVYMGVDYGVFGKFRFMTQAAYDAWEQEMIPLLELRKMRKEYEIPTDEKANEVLALFKNIW